MIQKGDKPTNQWHENKQWRTVSGKDEEYAYVEYVEYSITLIQFIGYGIVFAWLVYVYTFQQFHGGHIINLDYTILLKKEVAKTWGEPQSIERYQFLRNFCVIAINSA